MSIEVEELIEEINKDGRRTIRTVTDMFAVPSHPLQKRIGEWRQITFGTPHVDALHRRAREEMAEFQDVIHHNKFATMKEAADVVVTLFALAEYEGFDLLTAVERVQDQNELRRWKRHGDGTGQHIKEAVHE